MLGSTLLATFCILGMYFSFLISVISLEQQACESPWSENTQESEMPIK
jgi:hypothetical protein